jgi:hypothetical protein
MPGRPHRTAIACMAILVLTLLCASLPGPAQAGPLENGLAVAAAGDSAAAFKLLRPLAQAGDTAAQCYLGLAYLSGHGVAPDAAKAAKWLRMAAKGGNARAQNSLGWMCAQGYGVKRDDGEAARLFTLAADQGSANAQDNMGEMCYAGRGVPQDRAAAVKWWRLAAAQGSASAQCMVGFCYDEGMGLPRDSIQAAKWYRQAADQGYAKAQFNLGVMCYLGHGMPQDSTEAVKWWRLAADQGYDMAQYDVGMMYVKGHGVPKDTTEADRWFGLAATQGHADAARMLRRDKFRFLRPGMPFGDIVSLLSLDNVINASRFGGMFAGIGLFATKPSTIDMSYTGSVVLDGLYLTLEQNALVEWHIVEGEMGSGKYHGEYTNPIFKDMKGTWSLSGDAFQMNGGGYSATARETK